MPLTNRLKEHRARLGVNQQQLGSLAGVSRQTIIAIESGRYNASLELAIRLARHLQTTVEELFLLEETP